MVSVETKDANQLSDSEISEMADLSSNLPAGYDVGFVSKERSDWVLCSRVWDGSKLKAWSLYTLERIGGTPCMLIGAVIVEKSPKSESYLKTLLKDQYRRVMLAFPDEDVLVGGKARSAKSHALFKGLVDILPRPDFSTTGEERAWGRRLAKRFNLEEYFNDRNFVVSGNGTLRGLIEFYGTKFIPKPETEKIFKALNEKKADALITFGWAMAEDLSSGKIQK